MNNTSNATGSNNITYTNARPTAADRDSIGQTIGAAVIMISLAVGLFFAGGLIGLFAGEALASDSDPWASIGWMFLGAMGGGILGVVAAPIVVVKAGLVSIPMALIEMGILIFAGLMFTGIGW